VPLDTQSMLRADKQEHGHKQQPALAEAGEGETERGNILHCDTNGNDRAAEQHRGDERAGIGGDSLGDHGNLGVPST
jgi:hypothetical protein